MIKFSDLLRLAVEQGNMPRVHGNGFVQLDLNPSGTYRLHVWDDDVPRQEIATPIHDHVFDFRSVVLCGQLVHEVLRAESVTHGAGTHRVYRARREEGTQNTTLQYDGTCCTPEVEQRLVLGAGSLYTFPANRLHRTDHVGLTATVMEKVDAPCAYGSPRVLVPVGLEPDNYFHRDRFDRDFLWSIIDRALLEFETVQLAYS